jgi:hypothetical protein
MLIVFLTKKRNQAYVQQQQEGPWKCGTLPCAVLAATTVVLRMLFATALKMRSWATLACASSQQLMGHFHSSHATKRRRTALRVLFAIKTRE